MGEFVAIGDFFEWHYFVSRKIQAHFSVTPSLARFVNNTGTLQCFTVARLLRASSLRNKKVGSFGSSLAASAIMAPKRKAGSGSGQFSPATTPLRGDFGGGSGGGSKYAKLSKRTPMESKDASVLLVDLTRDRAEVECCGPVRVEVAEYH